MDAARVTEERRLELERASQKCGIRAHRHHGGRGVRKIGDCDDDVSVHVIQPARNERAPGAADTESPVRRHYNVSLPLESRDWVCLLFELATGSQLRK